MESSIGQGRSKIIDTPKQTWISTLMIHVTHESSSIICTFVEENVAVNDEFSKPCKEMNTVQKGKKSVPGS